MFSLYSNLLKVSFDSVKFYKQSLIDIKNWNKKIKEYNLIINTNIFETLKKEAPKNHQILLNSFNYYFNFHINKRKLSSLKNYTKYRFIFWSYFNHFYSYLHQIKEYFKNQISYYPLKKYNQKNLSIAFGFPEHAFNFSENNPYPSSFIEYIMMNNFIKKSDILISIDEYVRKSRKENILTSLDINSFKRIKLQRAIDYKKVLFIPFIIAKDIFNYFREYRILSFSLLIYYISQKSNFKPLLNLVAQIEKKNGIDKIYILDNLYLNQLLINKNFQIISILIVILRIV